MPDPRFARRRRLLRWGASGEPRVCIERDDGAFELYVVPPDIVVTYAEGHLHEEAAKAWIATIEPMFEQGFRARNVNDWAHLKSYDSAARQRLTRWVIDRVGSIDSGHFLVASRLVRMGVSAAALGTNVAALAAGLSLQLHAYSDEEEFERVSQQLRES